MTWFEDLTGFAEESASDVRSKLHLDGTRLVSTVNNRSFEAGSFSTPSLATLRRNTVTEAEHRIRVAELVGDVRSIHQNPANSKAVFQVASQFNCLEMAAPHVVPEDGVGIYEDDWTQGPACSICAGAGTNYRNYFATVNGLTGQTRDNQIDCLQDIGNHFSGELWQMENGYCFPTSSGLAHIENHLASCSPQETDDIRAKLRVGVQSKTQVTLGSTTHLVTQVFCSALPISYSDIPRAEWNYFPRLILDAAYEATFHIAAQNLIDTGCQKLYLTLVGGGVFGAKPEWILSSIGRSLELFAWANLDVFIVSHGSSNPQVVSFLAS